MDSFVPVDYPSVIIIGQPQNRVSSNSFNAIRLYGNGMDEMYARYGLTNADASAAVDSTTAVVATSAGAAVSLGVSPNLDHTAVGWGLNGRLRLFGRLVRVTLPDDVNRLEISMTGTASPYPESILINLQPDDCREVTFFVFCRAQGYRFIGHSVSPVDENTLHYLLPTAPSDCDSTAGGGTLYVAAKVYDSAGAQVVRNLSVSVWNVPYCPDLISSYTTFRGIAAPGASALTASTSPNLSLPNVQPIV
jgi:hypothetical protein